ncbi:MAG TPA: hypothetical protein VHU19_04420 [Pyrinomonadaceae bacterium]|nr:hypothetical protein [Pyrinomonadaceae bacterium]
MKTLRFSTTFLLITSTCLGGLAASAAQNAAPRGTPDAVVRELYRVHNNVNSHIFEREGRRLQVKFFDKRLADLIWKDITETPEGEVGHLDFDPLYSAQDMKITNFRVGAPIIEGDRATVPVSFNNYAQRTKITFRMHNTTEGWKVENIIYSGDNNSDLIKIMSEPQ